MKLRFSEIPKDTPILIVFEGLKQAQVKRRGYSAFLYLKAFFDFQSKGRRELEVCVPYDKFIKAITKLSVKKQRWIRDEKTELILYKRDLGYIEIEEVVLWKYVSIDDK